MSEKILLNSPQFVVAPPPPSRPIAPTPKRASPSGAIPFHPASQPSMSGSSTTLRLPFQLSSQSGNRGLDGVLDLGVLALDAGLHHGRVAEDEDGGGADEPEEGAEGRRDPKEGDADHEEAGVERLLGDNVLADLYWVGRC